MYIYIYIYLKSVKGIPLVYILFHPAFLIYFLVSQTNVSNVIMDI